MNIAFLHRDLPPDTYAGAAVQVHRLGNALCDLGQSVTVFTLTDKPEGARYAVRPIDFPGLAFLRRRLGAAKRLWFPLVCRSLDFRGFDAVHVHGDGAFLRYRGHFLRTFYGTAALEARHAATWKGKAAQGLSYALERLEARRAPRATALGAHVRDYLPGIRSVLPCMAAGDPDPGALAAKSSQPSLLYVGSRGGRKRGEWALRLWRELRSEFPDLVLHYVGPEAEGGAAETGLRFHSRLPEPRLLELYRSAWIALCFSSYEGFGVPMAEALSLGCCLVTTPHPGAREWLRDGETALFREPGEFREAVAGLMRDQEERVALARRGLRAAEAFAPRRVAEAYLALYREGRP